MSERIEGQIGRMVAVIDLHHPKITVDELEGMPEYQPMAPSRRRRWSGPLIAGATAAVVLAFGLLTFITRATAPEVPALSSPVVEPASEWSRIPYSEAVFGRASSLSSVTAGGPGLVAVGEDEWNAAVLTSVDGITWSRVPYDEEVFGGSVMSSVAAGGPGLVAVGWTGDGDIPDQDAAVLTSVDGITWSRVPYDEEVFGGSVMSSVTAGGPGLVAVGQTQGYWTDTDAVVWTSVDGIAWSRVPHDETIFGGPQKQSMYDVVVGGPGLVAVGRDGDERPWDNSFESAAAVWTSVDGIAWTRVPHDQTVFGTGGNELMLSVTAGGPGLVAVGAQSPGGSLKTPVWTSPDGLTWTRVPDDATVLGVMSAVTVGGPGLVAVGLDLSGATAVWTSVDGITWSQVPQDDAVFGRYPDWIYDVTVGGPGLVAVGDRGGNAAVWATEED